MTHRILTVALGTLLAAAPMAGCGGGGTTPATLLVAIGLPASTDADTATFIRQGADLAVRELNRAGGVHTGGRTYTLQLRIHDDASDPQRAAANTRAAIAAGAVGVIEDGIGAALSAAGSASAGVPEVVVADGDSGLPAGRRSVFRLGIANDAAATVLGGDISHRAASVAILHDDGGDGRDGARQLEAALATAQVRVTADREVPAALPALDAEVRALLDAHPAAVALWASPAVTSRALQALHAAGSTLPVFSGPAAEDPAVRRVAGAAATEGLSFVASRMTSESDSVSFGQFEHRLAAAEGGPIDAGIRDSEGRELRQPADQALFSYDAVRVLAAALERAGPHPGAGLLAAMTAVGVTSANGDHRGFNPDNHEGVADDDLYIAAIHDMAFAPVRDEPLSATLPAPDEILADFG
ncbi:MAG TPA: ABC transporter substrate-binding protein [Candidatus Dormibacteraeota bacterium]|nr:ABC transporter substrate-binding protein [Candidatus Dormibacteraeota bacterium]